MTHPRVFPRQALRHLPVGQGHTMSYRVVGNASGPVWLVLHGGPGSGANPALLRAFDLTRVQVVLPDQRGCGGATPRGGLRANQWPWLVQDLEAMRAHLGVQRWAVLGGSWGATLALAYAANHPDAVERLVLRGCFDASARATRTLLQAHAPTTWRARLRALPDRAVWHWLSQLLHSGTPGVTQRLTQWNRLELRAAELGARRALRQALPTDGPAARRHWRQLHRQLRQLPHLAPLKRAQQALSWQIKYRIQAHYLARRCHIRPSDWTSWLNQLAASQLPCAWVHGQFDSICPPSTSERGHAWLRQRGHTASHLRLVPGAHLPTDPAVLAGLWACTVAPASATTAPVG